MKDYDYEKDRDVELSEDGETFDSLFDSQCFEYPLNIEVSDGTKIVAFDYDLPDDLLSQSVGTKKWRRRLNVMKDMVNAITEKVSDNDFLTGFEVQFGTTDSESDTFEFHSLLVNILKLLGVDHIFSVDIVEKVYRGGDSWWVTMELSSRFNHAFLYPDLDEVPHLPQAGVFWEMTGDEKVTWFSRAKRLMNAISVLCEALSDAFKDNKKPGKLVLDMGVDLDEGISMHEYEDELLFIRDWIFGIVSIVEACGLPCALDYENCSVYVTYTNVGSVRAGTPQSSKLVFEIITGLGHLEPTFYKKSI